MNLTSYNFESILSKKVIQNLREENLRELIKRLDEFNSKYECLETLKYGQKVNSGFYGTIQTIQEDLEHMYKKEDFNRLFGLFFPWKGKSSDFYSTQTLLSIGNKFCIVKWNSYFTCLPVVSINDFILNFKSPTELSIEKEDYNPEYFMTPYAAMLSFYCDLVEDIQKKFGRANHPCEKRECNYNFKGRCLYEDILITHPENCLKRIK